jgi:hypothetical protein
MDTAIFVRAATGMVKLTGHGQHALREKMRCGSIVLSLCSRS